MKRWLTAVPVALALAACGAGAKVTHGTIVDRRGVPAHSETYLVTEICTGGKVVTCIPVFGQRWVPEQWELRLDDGKHRGWIDVDQATYAEVQTGQVYP